MYSIFFIKYPILFNFSFADGCTVEKTTPFYVAHWWYMDIFVYFSHHLVTIPPVGWINAAHKHGVRVLGIIGIYIYINVHLFLCRHIYHRMGTRCKNMLGNSQRSGKNARLHISADSNSASVQFRRLVDQY